MNYVCQAEKSKKNRKFKAVYPVDWQLVDFFDKHFKKQYYMEFNYTNIVLAPKRGNRAHDRRVAGRVWDIEARLKEISYIDTETQLSNLIHIVLTYPANSQSWESWSDDTRHFLDSLRHDKYVNLTDYIITLEATRNGVAHAHILLTVKDPVRFIFSRRYNPQTGKSQKIGMIADQEFTRRIKSKWKYINTVEAAYSTGAYHYIFKYITKGFSGVREIFNKYKNKTALSDNEYKALVGLYSLILHNKRSFRVSRSYKKSEPIKQENNAALDPAVYKAMNRCRAGWTCETCTEPCFSSLVIREAQLRNSKTEVTAFYKYESIHRVLFSGLGDTDVVKSFRYDNKYGWRSELWRKPKIYEAELY